jgi:hypothetical protein
MPVPNDPCHTAGGEVTVLQDLALPQTHQTRGIMEVSLSVSSYLPDLDSLEVEMSGIDPLQVGRCDSLPKPGGSCLYGYVVRRGMVARYLLVHSVCFSAHTFPALPVMFQFLEVFFVEHLVVPAVKSWVRSVKGVSGCRGEW